MVDVNTAIWILFGTFVILIVLRIPVMITLGVSSIITAMYLNIPLVVIAQRMVKGIESFSLLAIPFFIIAGEIMGAGGISNQLIKFSNVFVGRFRGGLAQVNVLCSMFFGGISGSAVADISSIGTMLIPAMKQDGYDDDFSVAVTVASSCQGIVIPPSHNMIIYSTAAGGLSVGALFLAGVVPGVLLGVAQMIVCAIIAIKRNYPKEKKITLKEAMPIVLRAIPGLMTIVIIMGGVLSGIFTATESAAIATIYAFLITFFFYRQIPIRKMKGILFNTLKTLAMVMSLIATASAFGYLMAFLQVPAKVSEVLLAVSNNKYIILVLINIVLLFLGMVMDMAPIIIIVTPILMPIIKTIGVDPIHFGVILMINLAIGLCTPPVGSALFVGCSIGKVTIEKATRAIFPFYLTMVAVLLVVIFIPDVVMFLPNLLR